MPKKAADPDKARDTLSLPSSAAGFDWFVMVNESAEPVDVFTPCGSLVATINPGEGRGFIYEHGRWKVSSRVMES